MANTTALKKRKKKGSPTVPNVLCPTCREGKAVSQAILVTTQSRRGRDGADAVQTKGYKCTNGHRWKVTERET